MAPTSWLWGSRTEHGALMILDLRADAPDFAGCQLQPLPTQGHLDPERPALVDHRPRAIHQSGNGFTDPP